MENYESENQELNEQVIPEEPVQASEEDFAEPFTPEPVENIFEEAEEETVPEEPVHRPVSPFADSPYVMTHQHNIPTPQPQHKEKKAKKSGGSILKTIIASVLIVALVAAGCGATAFCVNRYWQKQTSAVYTSLTAQIQDLQKQIQDTSYTGNGNSVSGTPNVSTDGMTPGQVYAKCVKSVVAIIANTNQGSSAGSGFIFSSDGYILTNYHVVENAVSVSITLHDGTLHQAAPIGYDDTNDIALLKIEGSDFPAVDIGSSDNLIVGDQVVAIGNPLGELTSTLTVGYISAKERDVSTDGTIINMLQTDAAINSGNSGGPLFNMKGEVIGITTAKYSGSTSSGASIEGIGFAIPIDDIADKVQQIITQGYVSTPYMGVSVSNRYDGIGAYIESVEKDGAAFAAGIQSGDLVTALGENTIVSVETLTKALKQFKVGDTTTVTILRKDRFLEFSITFKEKPKATSQTPSSSDIPQFEETIPGYEDWFDGWFEDFFGN